MQKNGLTLIKMKLGIIKQLLTVFLGYMMFKSAAGLLLTLGY